MFFYEKEKSKSSHFYQAYTIQDLSWPMHFHRSFELISVITGSILLILNEKEFYLTTGMTAFIFPNQLHAVQSLMSTEITIVHFSPELVGHFSTQYNGLFPQHPILQNIYLHAQDIQFSNIYEKKSFLYGMCAALTTLPDATFLPQTDLQEDSIFQILSYVDEHYYNDCTLHTLSTQLRYDYTYLSRLFKHKLGISFTQYLNQKRIYEACLLLTHTNRSISDIALQCGYDTIRSFNRNFKKIIGTTPKEYKSALTDTFK